MIDDCSEQQPIILLGFPSYLAWRVTINLLRENTVHVLALVDPAVSGRAEIAERELHRHVAALAGRFRWQHWQPLAADFGLGQRSQTLLAAAQQIIDLTDPGTPCQYRVSNELLPSLRLAARCPRLARFEFLSSAFVSGNREGVVTEDDFACGQQFKNRWEVQLFQHEQQVRAAALPITPTIYRPTFLVGDSRSGEIDHFSGAYALLFLIERLNQFNLPLPMFGAGKNLAHIVPVDYVARAIAHLARDSAAAGQTFHLVDPDAPRIWPAYRDSALLLIGRRPTYQLAPVVGRQLLRARLLRQGDISHKIIDYLLHHSTYTTANSHTQLAPAGIFPPSFKEYGPKVVNFFAAHCDDPQFSGRLA